MASTSSTAPRPAGGSGAGGGYQGKGRQAANQKKYGQPLPIDLPQSSSNASSSSTGVISYISHFVPSIFGSGSSHRPEPTPPCIGVYDHMTRSVWVKDRKDMERLFRKGFFGKGTLSRSEATWRDRRIDIVKGGQSALAEQIRAKRREERKRFKIERAAAMLDAAKQAEAVLTAAQAEARGERLPTDTGAGEGIEAEADEMEAGLLESLDQGQGAEGQNEDDALSQISTALDSTSLAGIEGIDVNTLTPQTFLVRPTRPDANRNRGRNAFKRKPKPKPNATTSLVHPGEPGESGAGVQVVQDAAARGPGQQGQIPEGTGSTPSAVKAEAAEGAETKGAAIDPELDEDDGEASEDDPFDELVPEMEHLQLALEEAWFLAAALGVLKIYNPSTESFIPNPALLSLLITPLRSTLTPTLHPTPLLYPDDPFLVSYVSYHHFRSLGWVVKPGIKFACDWLLYKKGPVFSHSAFAICVVPVYEDVSDGEKSGYGGTDWYVERMGWKWMNTVMRVNSLVQKTVIMAYVTIPAMSSFSSRYKTSSGSLDINKNNMRSLLERYTVRECSLTRFGPARRRD